MMVGKETRRRRGRLWVVTGASFLGVVTLVLLWTLLGQVSQDPAIRIAAAQAATAFLVFLLAAVGTWLHLQTRRLEVKKHVQDRADAAERQIAEQFDRAVDRLDSDKVAVQIIGVRELDRLGADHPEHREAIAEVWCSVLRSATPPSNAACAPTGSQLVRDAVQRHLLKHLRDPLTRRGELLDPPEHSDFWNLSSIDLRGAVLVDADFSGCYLPDFDARFANFYGKTTFSKALFSGSATFNGAHIHGPVDFSATMFKGPCTLDAITMSDIADFTRTIFRGPLECLSATFAGPVRFRGTQFDRPARFWKSRFQGISEFDGACWFFDVGFASAVFEEFAGFRHARFLGRVAFGGASFGGSVSFESAQFGPSAVFTGANFFDMVSFTKAFFDHRVAFNDAQFGGPVFFRGTRFEGPLSCCRVRFDGKASFKDAKFIDQAVFSAIVLGPEADLDLNGATASIGEFQPSDRVWPPGWWAESDVILLRLVPLPDTPQDHPTTPGPQPATKRR